MFVTDCCINYILIAIRTNVNYSPSIFFYLRLNLFIKYTKILGVYVAFVTVINPF